MVVLWASLVVRGKLISYYLMSPYVSKASVPTLLAKHKKNVAAVLKANNLIEQRASAQGDRAATPACSL
jgi:hypothetical protein